MGNDEARMTNDEIMTKPEVRILPFLQKRPFVIRISGFLRHSTFGLRILAFVALSSLSRAADIPWAFPDAPFRAVVRAGKEAPSSPDSGYLISLPELGQTTASMADIVLADAKGQPQNLAKAWRGEGQKVFLLAQTLAAGQDYFVYFGGNRARRQMPWTPKISLLMETRRLPAGTKLDDLQDLESAWKKANDIDGAGFVSAIDQGENPFGDSSDFIAHYIGWLHTDAKRLTIYTQSSDASFVSVNDRFAVGWPGKHPANANAKSIPKKDVEMLPQGNKIEYYLAKASEHPPTAVLGKVTGETTAQIFSAADWLHPGSSEITKIEHVQGWPVPAIDVQFHSYIGWNGLWLYDTQCTLRGGLPAGWTAEWNFDDGAHFEGAKCERVLPGPSSHSVRLRLTRAKDGVEGLERIVFAGHPREATTEEVSARDHYLNLLSQENPSLLAAATLKADFAFVNEFGTDQEIGRFATAWMAKNPETSDPMWIAGEVAHLRALAQSNPQQAVAEIHKLDGAVRNKYGKELGMAELDILVFGLKDPAAADLGKRVSFENSNSEVGRLAKIRIGDLYRLLGKTNLAVEQYSSVQKSIGDESQGRKNAAEDRANSITITDLIEGGHRHEAEQKVREWELEHPMAKYDSDLLLVRGRVLMLFGRWNEALQEIESFRQMQPDSPYQIPADFYRARALFELGKKDEARKIWAEIASKYPKHELAAESRRLSTQK